MSQSYMTKIDAAQPAQPASQITPPAATAPLLTLGGLAMVAMYALEIVYGLRFGRMMSGDELFSSWLTVLQALLFSGCLLLIALGLGFLGLALRPRAPVLASLAVGFAALAGVASACNFGLLVARNMPLGELGGVSVLANLVAAALLGGAALRRAALPRRLSWTLLAVGLITFPCILLTIPLEMVLPPFIVADLPFVVWGAIFTGLGVMLHRLRGASHAA